MAEGAKPVQDIVVSVLSVDVGSSTYVRLAGLMDALLPFQQDLHSLDVLLLDGVQ